MKIIVPKQPDYFIGKAWAMLILLFSFLLFNNTTEAQTRTVTYNSSGSWTAPCGVTSVEVYVWAAGGGGAGANGASPAGGGGGGGAFIWHNNLTVSPGTAYTITVGTGGSGGGANGGDGGNSSFGSLLVAGGGKGGSRSPATGGLRGTAITLGGGWTGIGGNGADGTAAYGGGGGSTAAPGYLGAVDGSGSTGGVAPAGGGNGGNGSTGNSDGNNGSAPGGGGGGARRTSGTKIGGDGGNGRVVIIYNGIPSGYCSTSFSGGAEPISQVRLTNTATAAVAMDNVTSAAISGAVKYENFCSPEATLARSADYTLLVRGNTNGNYQDRVRAWIDFNQNGIFETGEGMLVGTLNNSNGNAASTAISTNFTVPAGAVLGKTKMRIIKNYYYWFFTWFGDPTDPCGAYDDGQTEDYIVNIIGSCQQPTGATANNTTTSITVCSGTPVTLRQTGGSISADQRWEWTKTSCGAGYENRNTNTDAAYTFTPVGVGSTTFFVKAIDGTCGNSGPCQSVTVNVVAPGTITLQSGTQDFSACRSVASSNFVRYTIGGGATGASVNFVPALAGMSGTYAGGNFTLSGTPTAATGTYTYTISLSGNSPCTNPTISGTITITDKPTISYPAGPYVYCIGGAITPLTPVVTNGGLTNTYSISPLSATAALPAGLTLNTATGEITGTPTGPATGALNYTIRATNGCGSTDATPVSIRISAGNTIFTVTPSGAQSICSSSPGVVIGLSGSVTGISYQLYRNAVAIGSPVAGTNNPIVFPAQTTSGTYTVVALTNCATNMNGSLVLTVTPQPTASFIYPSYTYCKIGTSPAATISGTTAAGGTFSSTTGLVFSNTATGEIDLVASNPGSYSITYSAPASGGCATYTYTNPTQVTIATALNTYTVTGGGQFCIGGGGVAVGLNGSQNGIQYNLYRDGNSTGSSLTGNGAALNFGNQVIAGEYTIEAVSGSCTKWMDGQAVVVVNAAPPAITVNPASSTICQGTVIPLTGTLSPASVTSNTITIASGTVNQNIPDNSATGAFQVLRMAGIPAGATITGVSLNFNINHTYDGDLVINLKGPNGNVLNIANGIGGSANHFTNTIVNNTATTSITTSSAPFTGTFAPQAAGGVQGANSVSGNTSNSSSFSALYGSTSSSANGNWIFSVRDKANNDVGYIISCSIAITYSYVNNPTTVTWTPVTDLFTDPAGTIPYTAGANAATVYAKPTANRVYTATSANAAGCYTTATTSLTVNTSPLVNVTADYCSVAGKVRLTATSSNVDIATWLWNTGTAGTLVGARTSYIDVDAAGDYYVSAKASGSSCLGTGVMSIAQELVVNGDFSQGNTGFTSDYYYQPDVAGNNELVDHNANGGTNGYGVGTDAQNYHPSFYGIDHTTGTGDGNFMIVNGHGSLVVWKNLNVTVLPNTTYYFSAWGMSLNDVGPHAKLSFRVGSTNVGSTANLAPGVNSNANNGWTRFYGTWTSGPGVTSVDISIVNLETSLSGNDFAIDDISFATLSSFFTANPSSGSLNQAGICAGTPIDDIYFEVGGDGNPPTLSPGNTLPAGLTTYWNGRMFRISGSPSTPGTYSFQYRTSGCNVRTQTISLSVVAASEAGSFASSSISACYNASGTIPVTGTVGTLQWQTSADGHSGWTNVANNNYSSLTSGIYYRVIAQNTAACQADTSAIVKVGIKNLWTGKTNDNWNVATNWSDDNVPTMSPCDNLIIPDVSPKPFPVLTGGTTIIKNLDVRTGASITLVNDAVLQVGGTITSATGAINANDGTIEMNGTAAQSLSGSWFTGKNIEHLKISGTVLNISAAANDTLNILEKLSFGNTTADLNTNNNITLKSTATRTASVGKLQPGNAITGRFGIERYIKYFLKWNFVTAPVSENITVYNSWQEGGAMASTGFGTQITGGGANPAVNGLDASSASASLKWWTPAIANFTGVGNTRTELVNRKEGFYVYARGDRANGPGFAGRTTTLRAKGTIYDANNVPSYSINGAAGQFASLANPYASAVELFKLFQANNTRIQPNFYVWDPSLYGSYSVGGYQTVASVTGGVVTPGNTPIYVAGTKYPNIQSGQTILVIPTVANPTISFNEDMKADGSYLVSRGGVPGPDNGTGDDDIAMLSTTLYTTEGEVTDGNRVVFNNEYSNAVDMYDAVKLSNGVNFGLIRNGKNLAVEARHEPVDNDTLHFNMGGLPTRNFILGIAVQNIRFHNLVHAELVDRFTNTRTFVSLTDSTFIPVSTTSAAASKAADRFILVFKRTAVVLPVNFVTISARRQADRSIDVKWSVANEINIVRYEVERSANGVQFSGILSKDATGSNSYQQTDLSPLAADNFYRIKAIGIGNDITYSPIVKVAPLPGKSSISVAPNPVTDKKMNVVFTAQAKGEYKLQLSNMKGQVVYNGSVEVNTDSFSRLITLNPLLAAGTYQLNVTTADGSVKTIQVLVQ